MPEILAARSKAARAPTRLAAVAVVLAVFVHGGCSAGTPDASDSAPGEVTSQEAADEPRPGTTPQPTAAPRPSPTPEPTGTPVPTPTPEPTPTPVSWDDVRTALDRGDSSEALRIYDDNAADFADQDRASFAGLEDAMRASFVDEIRAFDRAVLATDFETARTHIDRLMGWFPDEPDIFRRANALTVWVDQHDSAVEWTGEVPHLFIHSLIVRTDLAFDGDYEDQGYRTYMITQTEFDRMLAQMYANDFILVDIHELYAVAEDGTVSQTYPRVPPGKKPFVFSIDDVSYYEYMNDDGFADRVVIDGNGQIATLIEMEAGQLTETRRGDAMPILDEFVLDHPDFSMAGHKGIMAVTGYEGVLGYDFSRDQTDEPDFEDRKNAATVVAERMREMGWKFASHSYTHGNWLQSPQSSFGRFTFDGDNWNAEIEPVVGDTDIYISPFGYHLSNNNPRYRYLVENLGFKIFNPISDGVTRVYNDDNVMMHRIAVDGYMLSDGAARLTPYFDPATVWDAARD